MDEKSVKEQPRSIRFPKFVWEALDNDAKLCGRSSSKQLEQLVRIYYELGAVEIDHDKVHGISLHPHGHIAVVGSEQSSSKAVKLKSAQENEPPVNPPRVLPPVEYQGGHGHHRLQKKTQDSSLDNPRIPAKRKEK